MICDLKQVLELSEILPVLPIIGIYNAPETRAWKMTIDVQPFYNNIMFM